MQLKTQNNAQNTQTQPHYNANYNCADVVSYQNKSDQTVRNAGQPCYGYQYYNYPQSNIYPQLNQGTQQQVQRPETSGVCIQIFNPSVATPGSTGPTYNVNAPNYYPNNCNQNGTDSIKNNPVYADPNKKQDTGVTENKELKEKQTIEQKEIKNPEEKQKTEKKKIVMLTDDYIRNLENYLNSQDADIRLNAAKEVYARLEEDPSRHNDKALTALVNKMLQDPSGQVRLLALSALDSRIVDGDAYSENLLKAMQGSPESFGQDAVDASSILLKMSGKQIEKEVPVTETKKKTTSEKTTKETK